MAAGTLPRPGTRLGPCVDCCVHTDCAETLRMADSLCVLCGKKIGYETRFYCVPNARTLVHAACHELTLL